MKGWVLNVLYNTNDNRHPRPHMSPFRATRHRLSVLSGLEDKESVSSLTGYRWTVLGEKEVEAGAWELLCHAEVWGKGTELLENLT